MNDIVIRSEHQSWSTLDLEHQIKQIKEALEQRDYPNSPIGIFADNSPHWIAVDLAAQKIAPLVPIPLFFSPEQILNTINNSGIDSLFTSNKKFAEAIEFKGSGYQVGELHLYHSPKLLTRTKNVYQNASKVTFTSGTTSKPKGVCLTSEQQWSVAQTLKNALAPLNIKRHLNVLPFAVLLENIAGVYTSILSGAENICLPLGDIGFEGSSQFNPEKCLSVIQSYQIESIILLPQMLHAITSVLDSNDVRKDSLKFVAVGGAKTPTSLLKKAKGLGLPIYEGYGLSECSSVVSLNLPNQERIGSVGKPLANRQIRIAVDGEIEVNGQGAVHYFGEIAQEDKWFATGDIGHLDADGYLYIMGRKKNILITGFGRNISPEWPESLLMESGIIRQTMVIGDARAFLSALIVPMHNQIDDEQIGQFIRNMNVTLPDYAQIKKWILVDEFNSSNDLLTPNGRLRRDAIIERYHAEIESIYKT
jgi:long-chain acyl-CoA synthetase